MLSAIPTSKGGVYGLPINYKSPTLIYNKDLVKTPPKTTDEMVKLAKTLTNAQSGRYGLAYWYTNFYFHSALMNAFGGAVFDKDGKLTVDSPATVASLNQMMTWYKKDGIMPTEPSKALIASMFNEGKAAMVINGPWFVGDIDKKINVGFAVLPHRRRGEEADAPVVDDRGRLRGRQLGQEGRRLRAGQIPDL